MTDSTQMQNLKNLQQLKKSLKLSVLVKDGNERYYRINNAGKLITVARIIRCVNLKTHATKYKTKYKTIDAELDRVLDKWLNLYTLAIQKDINKHMSKTEQQQLVTILNAELKDINDAQIKALTDTRDVLMQRLTATYTQKLETIKTMHKHNSADAECYNDAELKRLKNKIMN